MGLEFLVGRTPRDLKTSVVETVYWFVSYSTCVNSHVPHKKIIRFVFRIISTRHVVGFRVGTEGLSVVTSSLVQSPIKTFPAAQTERFLFIKRSMYSLFSERKLLFP